MPGCSQLARSCRAAGEQLLGRASIPLSVLQGESWVEGSAPVLAVGAPTASFDAGRPHRVQIGTLHTMLTFAELPAAAVTRAPERELARDVDPSSQARSAGEPGPAAIPANTRWHAQTSTNAQAVPISPERDQRARAAHTWHRQAASPSHDQPADAYLRTSFDLPPGFAPGGGTLLASTKSVERAAQRADVPPQREVHHEAEEMSQLAHNAATATSHGAVRSSWDSQRWREEQEAAFEAEMSTQAQQMLSIIGTEWSSQSAMRARDLDATLAELRNTNTKLTKVREACQTAAVS